MDGTIWAGHALTKTAQMYRSDIIILVSALVESGVPVIMFGALACYGLGSGRAILERGTGVLAHSHHLKATPAKFPSVTVSVCVDWER